MKPRVSVVALRSIALLITSAFLLSGCYKEYEWTRDTPERETLGHELWAIWKKDAERAADNADEKAQLLDDEYIDFVDAVDTIAPEDQLAEIDAFLINLLKLVDEGVLPALTRKLQVVLDEAAQNDALLEALAAPTGPPAESFVSASADGNFLGYASGFEDLPALVELQARIIVENDGLDENGKRTFDEPSAVSDLLRVAAEKLRETDSVDGEPMAVMVRDMLMREDPRYLPRDENPLLLAVAYDDRGYPLPTTDDDGNIGYPFVDEDGDGRADINAAGEFVFEDGSSGELKPFEAVGSVDDPVSRDDMGRAKVAGGDYAFEYINLHATGIGFMVRQFQTLSAQDTMYDMLKGMEAILGPKETYTDEIGGYQGYPVDQPMMDMSYALLHMLDINSLPELMEGMAEMTDRNEDKLAELLYAIDGVIEILDRYPDAEMNDDQTVLYDMLPLLEKATADPELWADIMEALRQPVSKKVGESLLMLLQYKDYQTVPAPDGPYDSCFQSCKQSYDIGTVDRWQCIRDCPNDEMFSTPMDFGSEETEQNRSNLQRFFHLLRDATGQPYTMDIEEAKFDGRDLPAVPALISLPDAGGAFIAAIAGNLDLADFVPDSLWDTDFGDLLAFLGVGEGDIAGLMSELTPLFGVEDFDRRPSADQITRLFNQQDIRWETDRILLDIADPHCKDGYVMSQHLAYLLFHAEAAGSIDAIYPLAKAFSDHGQEALLGEIHVVLHDHYASKDGLYKTASGADSPMKAANFRSYEAALAEILAYQELFDALYDFANATKEVEDATGLPVGEHLRQLLHNGLRTDGIVGRNGEDLLNINDGRTINNPSRMHFILHSMDAASARLDDVPESRERLDNAMSNAIDLMVSAEKDANGKARFKKPGSAALLVDQTRYMAEQAKEKRDAGKLSSWLTKELVTDMEDVWSSRLMASMVDLASNTLENEQDKATLDAFMAYLLGTREGQDQALIAAHTFLAKSVNSEQWLPVAKFLADVIDPDRTFETEPYAEMPMVSLLGIMLQRTLELDPENTGIFLIHRGLVKPQGGEAPFDVIIDVIARYLSPDPLAETFEGKEDYRHFIEEMSTYVQDDVHGMERLYELVARRKK